MAHKEGQCGCGRWFGQNKLRRVVSVNSNMDGIVRDVDVDIFPILWHSEDQPQKSNQMDRKEIPHSSLLQSSTETPGNNTVHRRTLKRMCEFLVFKNQEFKREMS